LSKFKKLNVSWRKDKSRF